MKPSQAFAPRGFMGRIFPGALAELRRTDPTGSARRPRVTM